MTFSTMSTLRARRRHELDELIYPYGPDSCPECRRRGRGLFPQNCNEPIDLVGANRRDQTKDRRGVIGPGSLGGFCLDQPESTIASRQQKVHFEALLIAKKIQLLRAPRIDLLFDQLCSHEALEQRSVKR